MLPPRLYFFLKYETIFEETKQNLLSVFQFKIQQHCIMNREKENTFISFILKCRNIYFYDFSMHVAREQKMILTIAHETRD